MDELVVVVVCVVVVCAAVLVVVVTVVDGATGVGVDVVLPGEVLLLVLTRGRGFA